jgi:hypothetical protein
MSEKWKMEKKEKRKYSESSQASKNQGINSSTEGRGLPLCPWST